MRFVPVRFQPNASVFKDQPCGGVYITLIDREPLMPVDVGITLALALHRLYPDAFALDKMEHLLQHPPTINAIKTGKSLAEIRQLWASDLDEFKKRREKFLIYK